MALSRVDRIYPHGDAALFQAAVLHTAGETGLNSLLVEKDYYCSLVLDYLFIGQKNDLVFKGGTCLSKVYADFYRMSEDLDFVIPVVSNAPRSQRRKKIEPMKDLLSHLTECIPAFSIEQNLRGHNESTQYIAYIGYRSIIGAADVASHIKVEIGLREELLEPAQRRPARTLLIDPFSGRQMLDPISIPVMSFTEAYSEKIRAALTRKIPAIRDFYDLFHAISSGALNINDARLCAFVQKKLQVPGNEAVDISNSRKHDLEMQLTTQLRPVLRKTDFERFDLQTAFNAVIQIAQKV
jgi:predicted nucleotidyltransferase component of viral defense system